MATELGTTQVCGMRDKEVSFKLDGAALDPKIALYPTIKWDNQRPTKQPLSTQP